LAEIWRRPVKIGEVILTFDLIGKNPRTRINLGYSHATALVAVLSELLGSEVDFLRPTSESECKLWANALRSNLHRLRLIKGAYKATGLTYAFLVVQGTDIRRMFSSGQYKHVVIDFEPSWEMAKELDDDWKEIVDYFIEFLYSCGGIARVV
jgi:hypothetical protein